VHSKTQIYGPVHHNCIGTDSSALPRALTNFQALTCNIFAIALDSSNKL
jgi:hypothetical protein